MQASLSDVSSVSVESAPASSFTQTCSACNLSMSGLFVRALGGFYHIECFKCLDCSDVVASKYVSITGPDGKLHPLCEKDYYRRLRHVCNSCKQFIQGPFITACGKKYHVDHFTCSECLTVFGKNDSYYEHDGKVLCHYHYSLIAAAKCTGCNVPIISRFVESKKNEINERWHPECYMINKFWKVKLGTPIALSNGNDKKMTNEDLQKEQNRSQVKSQHIWSILSAFEESSASCISEMLIQVSNGNYKDGVRMAEKFTMHVEILFSAIDRIEINLIQNQDSLNYQQEPKLLCRKIIGFFSLLTHTKDNAKNSIGITKDLLSQVTGVAHYLKSLIRIALIGALRLERSYSSKSAISNFLKMLVVHGDKDKASQWRMLAKMEAEIASELCFSCKEQVEEECIRFVKDRWHTHCLKCSKCEKPLSSELADTTFNQLEAKVYCKTCSTTGCESGFKEVSSLDQYSFLLRLSLRRLYSLLSTKDDSILAPESKYIQRLIKNNKSSPNFSDNDPIILNQVRNRSPERVRESDNGELDEKLIAIASKTPQRYNVRQRRSGSSATSIHNLSMIVHARKTLEHPVPMERQKSEGPPMHKDSVELPSRALSAESLLISASNSSTPTNLTKSYLCDLSELELLIVQTLSALSLYPLVGKFFTKDELFELIGSRKTSLWSRFKNNLRPSPKKPDGIFGVSLEILTEKYGVDCRLGATSGLLRIPSFVENIISVLKEMDMSIEGIFRKNGNIRRLKELTEAIDKDPASVDLSLDNPVQIAALLKKFLRDLPDPLITFKLHRLFIISQKLDDFEDRKKVLHLACCLLPRANRDTLEVIFVFFKWVAQFATVEDRGSKMDLENLATVITPNILYGKDKDPTKDESFLAINAVNDILVMQDDFWEVPESVATILQEVNLIEDKHELSTEEILRRCENYFNYGKAGPPNPTSNKTTK